MRIIALSDTHTLHEQVAVPDGDVLIYAGDFMGSGYRGVELESFANWFNALPHKKKILVAGNHDRLLEKLPHMIDRFKGVDYLWNTGLTYEGVTFWGSPCTPEFNNWAFNVPRGEEIRRIWDGIPEDTEVLITHGPPHGILDGPYPVIGTGRYEYLGCEELRKVVNIIKPAIHIFGHLHAHYGSATMLSTGPTEYYNVSICNEAYRVQNPCTVIDYD